MKKAQEKVWEGIADSWNERRNKPLKEAIEFLEDKKRINSERERF